MIDISNLVLFVCNMFLAWLCHKQGKKWTDATTREHDATLMNLQLNSELTMLKATVSALSPELMKFHEDSVFIAEASVVANNDTE